LLACIWHRIIHRYKVDYSYRSSNDDEVGNTVLKWVLHICYTCETECEWETEWGKLLQYLTDKVATASIVSEYSTILENYLEGINADRRYIAPVFTPGRGFGTYTTTRCEGDNYALKMRGVVSDTGKPCILEEACKN
jgi:hypothetical protein